jgi:predicted GNAT family acetyltransferase
MSDDGIEVEHEPERSRFVLRDGEKEIGEERYLDTGSGERILFHTVVSEEYSGRGLAGRLVQEAVEVTIADALAVVPVCPYVRAWLPRHPEYAAHVVEPTPEHFARLGQEHS